MRNTEKMKSPGPFLLLMLLFVAAVACSPESSKPYVVARDPTWYPLSLMSRDRNVLAFSDDLLHEIAERQSLRIRLVQTGPTGIEPGLRTGAFDAVMTTMRPNAFLRDRYRFSEPYFFAGVVLVVPFESNAKNLKDLVGQRVGVRRGSLRHYEVDSDVEVKYEQYENIVNAIEAMQRGELEGVLMDLVPAAGYARGIYRGKIKVVGPPLSTTGLRLVTHRGHADELVDLFNEGLRATIEDGTYLRLREKWGLWQQQQQPRVGL